MLQSTLAKGSVIIGVVIIDEKTTWIIRVERLRSSTFPFLKVGLGAYVAIDSNFICAILCLHTKSSPYDETKVYNW